MHEWKIEKVPNRNPRRAFVWRVTCPGTPDLLPEPTWDNDFGRGMRCGCRHFRSEGKARRYVERMTAA